jgi:hypothetical protein
MFGRPRSLDRHRDDVGLTLVVLSQTHAIGLLSGAFLSAVLYGMRLACSQLVAPPQLQIPQYGCDHVVACMTALNTQLRNLSVHV